MQATWLLLRGTRHAPATGWLSRLCRLLYSSATLRENSLHKTTVTIAVESVVRSENTYCSTSTCMGLLHVGVTGTEGEMLDQLKRKYHTQVEHTFYTHQYVESLFRNLLALLHYKIQLSSYPSLWLTLNLDLYGVEEVINYRT